MKGDNQNCSPDRSFVFSFVFLILFLLFPSDGDDPRVHRKAEAERNDFRRNEIPFWPYCDEDSRRNEVMVKSRSMMMVV